MTKETQIPAFHVKQNLDIELYEGRVKEDKVYLKDERVAQFTNAGVFTVVDRRKKRSRRFKAVIYLDGKANCAEIRTSKELTAKVLSETNQDKLKENPNLTEKITGYIDKLVGNAYTLFEPLTDMDRKTVVKREIAKQLGKFKPIQTWQFIIILVMLGVIIALRFI